MGDLMNSKSTTLFIVIQLLLTSWATVGVSSAAGEPTTAISIHSPYHGNTSNGAHVFVGQNPNFSLSVSAVSNSSIIGTEYEITRDGFTTTQSYSSNAVTIAANYSTNIALRYRSNSTTGLESWKSLSLTVDADPPELSASSAGNQPLRYTSNASVYVTSSQIPLKISCLDNSSGTDALSGRIGQSSISGANGELLLSPSNLPAGITGSSTFTIDISCNDNVDNFVNQSFSVILDDSNPMLSVQEHGTRVGTCVSSDWWLAPHASDNHTTSIIERQNGSSWEQVSSSIGVHTNYNGTISLRASDSTGHNSTPQSWTVAVDTLSPVITASLNQSTLTASSVDSCGISNLEFRWETLTGTTYGWTSIQGNQSIPAALNGSIVRAQIRSTDLIGNSNITNTAWVNTNGSSPYSSVTVLSDRVGSIIAPDSRLLLNPVGFQAVGFWQLSVNNQTFDSGNISTQTILQNNFSDSDYIELSINTTDALGDSSNFSWNWIVDGANSHQISISISGNSINSSGLILGPTGRLVPAAPSDDSSGVGGSHAICTWDNSNWFGITSGGIFSPTTSPGTVQSYTFGCRSVDLLGNEAPISWMNGSVDAEAPSISIQPGASQTIGLQSLITVNMSDTNGLGTGLLQLQWTNSTSTVYSNITVGTANWSSSLNQLFSGLSDGTITANIFASDALGNSGSILGRIWTLNTSHPFISVIVSGDSFGNFISSNSTAITLTPPAGGWTGIWMEYTMTNSAGSTVFNGNVTATTTLQPTSLPGGYVWLNTTTGDALGRIQQQGWIFYVDDTNSQSPILDIIGLNSTINNSTWIGTGSKFRIRGISDDSSGAGANYASCSWDGNSWFQVSENSQITPSVLSGTHQALSLRCQSVDFLGNAGPLVWRNATYDSITPTQVLAPASGTYIAPHSIISMSVSDHSGILSSVLRLTWTDGQNSWQSNISIPTSTWSSSLNNIRSNLTDGSISVSLYSIDNLGNEAHITGRSWTLNTTQPISSVSVTGSVVGSYVASDGFTIHITPPSSGGSTGWSLYTLEHENGSTIASGNISQATQIDPEPLNSGQIWLNLTSHDTFSRNQSQSWVFNVDTDVNSLPIIGLQGSYTNQSGNPILGPTGNLQITSMQDDVGGVGSSHATCTWNGEDWFNTNQNSPLTPQSSSGSVVPYTLGCAVVDLVGNTGPIQWMNGTVDVENPTVSYSIGSGSLLSQNSTFTVSCSDSNGCILDEISALFNNGSVSSWHPLTLSGTSAGVSLSAFLNVSESGTVTFYTNAQDQISNAINYSSNSFQYLHDVPTLSLVVQSNHSGAYVDGDLTFVIVPSSGWMSGISVNLTVEHSLASSPLFSGAVNQSLSTHSFSDLDEGQLWANGSICDVLNRCSSASVQLLIDRTGPNTPSFSVNNGHILSNQSHIVQGSTTVTLFGGSDTASGTHRTICSSENGDVTFSSTQVSVMFQSLVVSDSWSTIECYSWDSVGNLGGSIQFTVFRDDNAPSVTITDESTSSVISPSNWYNASCSDDILYDEMVFEIFSNGTLVYQLNTSGDVSVRYGTINTLGSGGSLDLILTCSDAAGNHHVDNRNLEWLPELFSSIITVGGVQSGGTHYVANSETVTLSNSRNDVYHEIRYIVNGTAGTWHRVNSTSFTFDLEEENGFDAVSLRIEVRVFRTGSMLMNSSISNLMTIDFSGPSVNLDSNSILSNGSVIDLSAIDSGVGISHYIWSWDNGTNQQSSVITDVRLSTSSSSSSWLTLQAVDRLGNQGDVLTASITRDLTPPIISIVSSHPGYLGPNSTFEIDISETTGLASSTLQFNSPNGQIHLIANNVSSYQITSSDFPSWIWNHSTIDIFVEAESTSELYVSYSLTFIPDNVAPQVSIDSIQSTYLFGANTSNHSQLHLSIPVDIAYICVKVGSNQVLATSSDCLTSSQSAFQYHRTAGAYVMIVNATDFSGNNQITIFNLQHHSNFPQISDSIPTVLRPTTSQAFNYSSTFPASVEIFWDSSQIQHSGSLFTVPTGSGTHSLLVNVTNAVGLSSERSWSITLDGNAPTISLEGEFYSGTDFGSDTILYVNSSDVISEVHRVNLTISSLGSNCTMEWQPIASSFSINGTLANLLATTSCSLLQTTSASLTIDIFVEDSVGNIGSSTDLMNYHGGILPPTWTTENTVNVTQYDLAGPHSNFTCNAAPGAIQPHIQISWSGTGGIISDAEFTGISGDGVLVCEITDAFGNAALNSINLTYDSSPALCTPQQFVASNETTFVLPATRSSIFSCSDNLAGVRSVGWQAQGMTQYWTLLQNGSWSAPPPVTNASILVTVDEVGNVYSESFEIIFDDLAPELTIVGISGISFDENIARPDGQFLISCVDITSVNCLMRISEVDALSNTVISTQVRYNSGNISLSLPPTGMSMRLDIVVEDEVGNIHSTSLPLLIDGTSPNLVVSSRSPISGSPLPIGIVADNGILTIDGLSNSDVNLTLSTGVEFRCLNPQSTPITDVIQFEYDLTDYALTDCKSFEFTVGLSDHVGNLYNSVHRYTVDFIYPSVSYSTDSSCSWQASEHIDMQSYCPIIVEVIDDESQELASQFSIQIREQGSTEFETMVLNRSTSLDLSNYTGKMVLISVTGTDRVQRPIDSNLQRVLIRDQIEPLWDGLICAGNLGCDWSGTVIASHMNTLIGVTTFTDEAPIVNATFTFENAVDAYESTQTYFSHQMIPDGTYTLTVSFTDAAGRVFNPGHITFVYDNQAPIIDILETQSNGYQSDSLVLSCDYCNIVWRIIDESASPSTTNHGTFPLIGGQYTMSTASLGNNTISISATDELGRTSVLNITTISIQTTEIDPVEEILYAPGVSMICLESSPSLGIRQVTCLWSRSGIALDYLPLEIDLEIDQLSLRDVDVVIEREGGSTSSLDVTYNGRHLISEIKSHTTSFTLTVADDFSEVTPLRYTLIEHVLPWSELRFEDSSLSEQDTISTFSVTLNAPIEELEYHLLDVYSIDDIFSCSSVYEFSREGQYIQSIRQNCEVLTSQSIIRPDGTVVMRIQLNHQNIRPAEMPTHQHQLFNLDALSVIVHYNDDLGVNSTSLPSDLRISADEIFRVPDSPPILYLDEMCPLGQPRNQLQTDGFLQSDVSAPLSKCADFIEDDDGIHEIVWNITFTYDFLSDYVDVVCRDTFFPEDWNLREAIESDNCHLPEKEFPGGSGFRVTIRPYVIDESQYRENQKLQPLRIYDESCAEQKIDCEVAELVLYDVTVSSNLDPTLDVERSRDLVNWGENAAQSTVYQISMFAMFLLLMVIFSIGFFKYKFGNSRIELAIRDFRAKIVNFWSR